MGVSFANNSYFLAKIGDILLAIIDSIWIQAGFSAMINDICNPDLIAFSNGFSSLGNASSIFITRFLIDNQDNYVYFSFFVSGLIIFSMCIFNKYMIETQKLEKTDIYQILRGLATREECIEKNKKIIDSIKQEKKSKLEDIEMKLINFS